MITGYMIIGYIIGGILGLAIGTGIAFAVTMTYVKKSNDIGDAKGTLQDFGELYVISSEDGLDKENPNKYGYDLLEDNLQKILEEEG